MDTGSWPYIIFAIARTRDNGGELFGYGTCVEGDTSTYWFRFQDACFEAITDEVFFHWASGQSDGRTTSPPPPLNCRSRTLSPTPAGSAKSSWVVPAITGRDNPSDTPSVDNIIEIPSDYCPLSPDRRRKEPGCPGTGR
ncbi:hypothetical protein QFZ79_000025 [Arthrobacter sp. V4I6]|nr:hypothetical protein [Arthrobacter sp. V1I7]MDQ0851914.1 hypothetical protein [Arthrobacter sp. V4I6]